MSEKKIFFLSWKGTESGPFSEGDIREMLECGKIGLLYQIRTETAQWRPLKDADLPLMANEENASAGEQKAKADSFAFLVYIIAGLAFLSPWILFASVSLSIFQWVGGDKKGAFLSFATALLISLCGILFFEKIFPLISA